MKVHEVIVLICGMMLGFTLHMAISSKQMLDSKLDSCVDKTTDEVLAKMDAHPVQDYLGLPQGYDINLNMAEAYVDHLLVSCLIHER